MSKKYKIKGLIEVNSQKCHIRSSVWITSIFKEKQILPSYQAAYSTRKPLGTMARMKNTRNTVYDVSRLTKSCTRDGELRGCEVSIQTKQLL